MLWAPWWNFRSVTRRPMQSLCLNATSPSTCKDKEVTFGGLHEVRICHLAQGILVHLRQSRETSGLVLVDAGGWWKPGHQVTHALPTPSVRHEGAPDLCYRRCKKFAWFCHLSPALPQRSPVAGPTRRREREGTLAFEPFDSEAHAQGRSASKRRQSRRCCEAAWTRTPPHLTQTLSDSQAASSCCFKSSCCTAVYLSWAGITTGPSSGLPPRRAWSFAAGPS